MTLRRSRPIRATLLAGTAAFVVFSTPAWAAFDPNTMPPSSLPSPSALYEEPAVATGAAPPPLQPLYPTRVGVIPVPAPAAATEPSAPVQYQYVAPAPSPAEPTPIPAPAIAAEVRPSTPAPITAEASMPAPAPTVTAEVPSAPPGSGFIAPTPVFADMAPAPQIAEKPIAAAPAATPRPIRITPPVAVAHSADTGEDLSSGTKSIISHIPSKLDTIKPKATTKIAIDRISPEVQDALGASAKEEAYEAVGISIKVRRPGLDANYELNRAYTALMGGETDTAIQIYRDVLGADPKNLDALFGLATTYHRLGNLDKARPLYGMLLKLNPTHRDGLSNFLSMVGSESPQEALAELERLEQRNPDFSPIPAQQAIVLSKLGYMDEARTKMLRAIELSPDNLTYKYNLAVMLDSSGYYADAGALYRLLIKASAEGQKVPASMDLMQKRLNFITTSTLARAQPMATGG